MKPNENIQFNFKCSLQVKISPNFKILNVFWITKDCKNEDEVEQILRKNAGYLKSELSALRVMGIVPDIHFVKGIYFLQQY